MAEITGTSARDTLTGTGGADVLAGGDGADTLMGGAGDDILYGQGSSDTDPANGQIDAVRVASGLSSPLFAASPPGEPDRLFVVEQHTGRIRILDLNSGQTQADAFLDLPDNALAGGGEQGLLGLAFHPDYASNGRFYVYLTNPAGDIELREYRRADADHADAGSGRLVLTIDHPPPTNHNGGWMAFGPDRMLYVATGDGGGSGDPGNNAQNRDSLLGKVLRIDVDGDAFPADASRNYAIPAGNPFAGAVQGADEVWLYGLRNPWRGSFDSATGDLWIGDVGQGQREEVNLIPAGQGGLNLGWRFMEGNQPYSGTAPAGLTPPLLDYDRTTPLYSGVAVTGGYVYHGPGGGQGLYWFGDFASGNIWSVSARGGAAQDFLNRNGQIVLSGGGDLDQIASFAVDGRGRLYVVGLDGDIHRLTPRAGAGDASDYIRGEDGDDLIYGGLAFDDVHGNTGQDSVHGGQGNDWVVGGQGSDRLWGDEGDDIVYGNLGFDTLEGGAGADLMRGGQADDVLTGQDGNDWISGDRGDDTVSGGAGADTFHTFGEAGLDRVTDFSRAQGDRVQLLPGQTYVVNQTGDGVAIDMPGGGRMLLVGVQMSSLTGDWIFGA
ncbi:PQQ-dependent sugar dehydrogenase [Phenylobacterium sp.]|jgi:glucose/arabinose dehydrogenase|uniref:PQQ-dependent sugar dehydrogenase n=1 Tax=Phenylobacterium sp. TaxID=1871053 RepID=UPI002F93FC73